MQVVRVVRTIRNSKRNAATHVIVPKSGLAASLHRYRQKSKCERARYEHLACRRVDSLRQASVVVDADTFSKLYWIFVSTCASTSSTARMACEWRLTLSRARWIAPKPSLCEQECFHPFYLKDERCCWKPCVQFLHWVTLCRLVDETTEVDVVDKFRFLKQTLQQMNDASGGNDTNPSKHCNECRLTIPMVYWSRDDADMCEVCETRRCRINNPTRVC